MVDGGVVAQESTPTPAPTNNSTRHEDPDEVDESGNQDALRRYLAQRLAERLGQSSVQISKGQYEQGQSALGDEYNDLLAKYVDVTGDTDSGRSASSFERAQENQQEYAQEVQEYNETYAAYQEAKQNGNETRARELARELERQQQSINRTSQNLSQSYQGLENETGANLTDATSAVSKKTQNVSKQQQSVVEAEFEQTTLTVATDANSVSFLDSVTVEGRLRTENGSGVTNQTVELRIGGDRVRVTTGREGRFSFDYRPVRAPVNSSSLPVRYVPASTSVFLGSNSSLALSVTQTNATVTITDHREAARFGDQVVVNGTVDAADVPVDSVPVVVQVDGVSLGTVQTDAEGTFSVNTSLPADIAAGEQSVTVDIAQSGRAITGEQGSSTIAVEETTTDLSVSASQSANGSIQVDGRLQTADGRPIAKRTLELRLDGSTVTTVRTNAEGRYSATLTVPDGVNGSVAVQAVYDDPVTNLGAAKASDSVTVGAPQEGTGFDLPVSTTTAAGVGTLVVAMLGVGVVARWRQEDEGESSGPASVTATNPVEATDELDQQMLDQARTLIESGVYDNGIQAAYAASRDALSVRLDVSKDGTHWEFFTRVQEVADSALLDDLQRLTEAYEATTYAGRSIENSEAADLLAVAESLTEFEE